MCASSKLTSSSQLILRDTDRWTERLSELMKKEIGLTNSVQFRFLGPSDVDELKRLCSKWFPIEYPDSWYQDITSSPRFYSLAAVLDHQIIGVLISEVKSILKCNPEDSGILGGRLLKDTKVAYILSLGVVKEFRKNGIASLLLNNLFGLLTTEEYVDCKAVYLHVLTTNFVALRFYERHKFRLFRYMPCYYAINGYHKNGYLYVLYINGGQPPWTFSDVIQYGLSLICRIQPCRLPFIFANKLWSCTMRLAFDVQRRLNFYPSDTNQRVASGSAQLKNRTDMLTY